MNHFQSKSYSLLLRMKVSNPILVLLLVSPYFTLFYNMVKVFLATSILKKTTFYSTGKQRICVFYLQQLLHFYNIKIKLDWPTIKLNRLFRAVRSKTWTVNFGTLSSITIFLNAESHRLFFLFASRRLQRGLPRPRRSRGASGIPGRGQERPGWKPPMPLIRK